MFRFLSKALGFAGYVVQYACITHCTFEYLGDFVLCSGPSMEPTLYTNNVLLTERITARMRRVRRGDIIIARCPVDPKNHICKRVVGLPGDRIIIAPNPSNMTEFKQEAAKIGSSPLLEDEVGNASIVPGVTFQLTKGEYIVPRGHIWIEGDNASNSADSRSYGPVPLGLVNSRAILRVWPLSDVRLLI